MNKAQWGLIAALAMALSGGSVLAQPSTASPPSVTTSNANKKTAAAPVKGANSFTMNEARRRIEAGGFSQVSGLKKDRDGIWRGTGMRDGAAVPVYCDYQGNVGAS